MKTKQKNTSKVYRYNLTLPRCLFDWVKSVEGFNLPGDYIRFLIQKDMRDVTRPTDRRPSLAAQ